ncbi:hypothetical protein AgCh_038230 [Apium graveolens]
MKMKNLALHSSVSKMESDEDSESDEEMALMPKKIKKLIEKKNIMKRDKGKKDSKDPSQNFDLDPSRILGQPFNPGRRISTRIHDLDFDQDPSRTFDLNFGRNFCHCLIRGRRISTRFHDLDFDQDPSRNFDLDFGRDFQLYLIPVHKVSTRFHDLDFGRDFQPYLIPVRKNFDLNPGLIDKCFSGFCSKEFEQDPRLQFRPQSWSEVFEPQNLYLASQPLSALLLQMADKRITCLAKMNVAKKSSEFPIRSRYTSLIDMINSRGDEYPSDAHLDVHDHISVSRDPKELDKLTACFKIKEPFKLVLAGPANRACQ